MGERFEFDALVTATFEVEAPTLLDAAAAVRAIQEGDPDDLGQDVLLRSLSWGVQVDGELVLLVDGGMGDPVILDRMSDPATRPPDTDPEDVLAAVGAYKSGLRTGAAGVQAAALRTLVNMMLARWPEVAEQLPNGL